MAVLWMVCAIFLWSTALLVIGNVVANLANIRHRMKQ